MLGLKFVLLRILYSIFIIIVKLYFLYLFGINDFVRFYLKLIIKYINELRFDYNKFYCFFLIF